MDLPVIRFPTWRKVPEFKVFASLLRMTTKYGFSDVYEQLLHSIKGAYPIKWEAYKTTSIIGEDVFGTPEPHPNAVLNLFLEQKVRFAIPLAAYRAALGGFSSLVSGEPGTVLPRLTLASNIYGMEVMRGGLSRFAYSIVCNMRPEVCRENRCFANGDVDTLRQGRNGLDRIYDAVVKEGKGDVFSSLSLGDIFCARCARQVERDYDVWCASVWKKLPCIFRVGQNWDEV